MDFMMMDKPGEQKWMRSGLAWFEGAAWGGFRKSFVEMDATEHAKLLDALAWPDRAMDKDGANYFRSFRNLAMTGFWTTKVGIEDLQYMGNTFVKNWEGCPQAALDHLHVSYE
jgi:hypothetical protein